jgi:hypothetical protein
VGIHDKIPGRLDTNRVNAINANEWLATILWGNVGINARVTLLSNSVMAGMAAFPFFTFLITFL